MGAREQSAAPPAEGLAAEGATYHRPVRTTRRRLQLSRIARDGFLGLALGFLALRLLNVRPWDQSVDAYSYWATHAGPMYGDKLAGAMGAYLYSPAFAQLMAPITWLPWPLFSSLWTAANLALVWFLLGRWSLPAMLFLPIPFEVVSGNVHLLYAAAIVVGFRWAGTWALPLITKVTPGVGILWFLARREWRQLALALGVTAALVGVSWVLDPTAWRHWIGILTGSSSTPETVGWYIAVPLLWRLPVAALVALAAGLTNRAWLVPVAVVLAMPIIWLNSLAVLAACAPLAGVSGSLAARLAAPSLRHVGAVASPSPVVA